VGVGLEWVVRRLDGSKMYMHALLSHDLLSEWWSRLREEVGWLAVAIFMFCGDYL